MSSLELLGITEGAGISSSPRESYRFSAIAAYLQDYDVNEVEGHNELYRLLIYWLHSGRTPPAWADRSAVAIGPWSVPIIYQPDGTAATARRRSLPRCANPQGSHAPWINEADGKEHFVCWGLSCQPLNHCCDAFHVLGFCRAQPTSSTARFVVQQ